MRYCSRRRCCKSISQIKRGLPMLKMFLAEKMVCELRSFSVPKFHNDFKFEQKNKDPIRAF